MGFVTGHTDWAFPMKLLKLSLSRVLAPLVIFAGLAFLPGCGDRDSMDRPSTGMCAYKEISRIESPSKLRIAVTGYYNCNGGLGDYDGSVEIIDLQVKKRYAGLFNVKGIPPETLKVRWKDDTIVISGVPFDIIQSLQRINRSGIGVLVEADCPAQSGAPR